MITNWRQNVKLDPLELTVARLKAGLRQYQVAAAVGIAPCRLSEIETGRREPSPELLESILKVIRTAPKRFDEKS